jgi:hypothetical protein
MNELETSFVSKLRTAWEGWRYLGLFSVWLRWFVNILLLHGLREIIPQRDELFHNPIFPSGCVVFSAVDSLFTFRSLAFTFSNLQFSIQEFLGARANPSRWHERVFFDDLFDDSLHRSADCFY